MLNFCPKCGNKLFGDRFCPNCGADLTTYGETFDGNKEKPELSALDSALEGLMDLAKEKQTADKLRVMVIRGQIDEATAMCNELIDKDPMDTTGYIGLIRIASDNFKKYEGNDIAEQIRVAEEVFEDTNALNADAEYVKYIAARKAYFEDKENKRKAAEEAERARIEAEQRRMEAIEAEKMRAQAERAKLVLESNGYGTYKIVGVTDKTITSITIPDDVTCIGKFAFKNCENLTSVIISDRESINDLHPIEFI